MDNKELCYHYLADFDASMIHLMRKLKHISKLPVTEINANDADQVLAFQRGDLFFFFNFSPTRSYTGYGFLVEQGAYEYVLNSDSVEFGGNGFNDDSVVHYTNFDPLYAPQDKGWLSLYLPARTACVLHKIKE